MNEISKKNNNLPWHDEPNERNIMKEINTIDEEQQLVNDLNYYIHQLEIWKNKKTDAIVALSNFRAKRIKELNQELERITNEQNKN